MQFRYRWFYRLGVFSSVLVGGFLYYLQNDFQLLSDAKNQKQILETRHSQGKSEELPGAIVVNKKALELLPDLMNLLQMNGLSTQMVSVKTLQVNSMKVMDIKLDVLGNFKSFLTFADAIAKQPFPLFILNFACNIAKDQEMQISFDVLRITNYLSHGPFAMQKKITREFYNPFCNAVNSAALPEMSLLQQAKLYSIKQMRYVGFLMITGEPHAFLQLPDNQVIDATLNAILGYEQAQLIAMNERAIHFRKQDNQQITLLLGQ